MLQKTVRKFAAGALGPNPTIECLIFVSGPTGVGKTSFIEQLFTRSLSREIGCLLPEGAETWGYLSATRLRHRPEVDETSEAVLLPGLVFHYDMARPYRLGVRYDTDPALGILKSAATIIVADIRAPLSVLMGHQAWRATQRRRRDPAKHIFDWIRRRLGVEASAEDADPEAPVVRSVYNDPRRLDDLYRRWDSFLAALAARGDVRIVRIEAVLRKGRPPAFRLGEPSQG